MANGEIRWEIQLDIKLEESTRLPMAIKVLSLGLIYEDGSLEVTCLNGAWTGRYLPKEELINPYGDRYVPSLLVEPYDDFGKSFLED